MRGVCVSKVPSKEVTGVRLRRVVGGGLLTVVVAEAVVEVREGDGVPAARGGRIVKGSR